MFMNRGDKKGIAFKKWDVIKVKVERARDHRLESYKVLEPERIKVIDSVEDWEDRRRFAQKYLDPDMETLWEQKRSLGIIKPKILEDFKEKERNRITDEGEKDLLDKSIQALLPEFEAQKPFWEGLRPRDLPWIGYHFFCQGKACNMHQMMCIDWEIQELYRRVGLPKTKQKAIDFMSQRDLYFGVGTTWRWNTWMIISLIYPPKMLETPLIESLGREPEPLATRKGGMTGQLRFTKDGLEGQEKID